MKFGVLLPHFGDHCTYERVFENPVWLETVGFDSVWVRDHLSFRPHGFEGHSTRFLEPFTTLAGVAAKTERLTVGTAVAVPFRHPLITAQLFGGLSYVARNRLVIGVGSGTPRAAFDAVGIPFDSRVQAVRDTIAVLRATSSRSNVDFEGECFSFKDMTIDPHAPADLPIWYGGTTRAGIRIAVELCDGWMPSRIPFQAYDGLLRYLEEKEAEKGKKIAICQIPLTHVVHKSMKPLADAEVQALLKDAVERKKWVGTYERLQDLRGAVITGSPQEIVDQIGEFEAKRMDHLIFDLRTQYQQYEDALEVLASDVLPHFKA